MSTTATISLPVLEAILVATGTTTTPSMGAYALFVREWGGKDWPKVDAFGETLGIRRETHGEEWLRSTEALDALDFHDVVVDSDDASTVLHRASLESVCDAVGVCARYSSVDVWLARRDDKGGYEEHVERYAASACDPISTGKPPAGAVAWARRSIDEELIAIDDLVAKLQAAGITIAPARESR